MLYKKLKQFFDAFEIKRYPVTWFLEVPDFEPSIRRFYDFLRGKKPNAVIDALAYAELAKILEAIETDFQDPNSLERQLVRDVRADSEFLILALTHFRPLNLHLDYQSVLPSVFPSVLPSVLPQAVLPPVIAVKPFFDYAAMVRLVQPSVREPLILESFDFGRRHEPGRVNAIGIPGRAVSDENTLIFGELTSEQKRSVVMIFNKLPMLARNPKTFAGLLRCRDSLIYVRNAVNAVGDMTALQFNEFVQSYILATSMPSDINISEDLKVLAVIPGLAFKCKLMRELFIRIEPEVIKDYCNWLMTFDAPWSHFTLGLLLSNELLFNVDYNLNAYDEALQHFKMIPSDHFLYEDAQNLLMHFALVLGNYQLAAKIKVPLAERVRDMALTFGAQSGVNLGLNLIDRTPINPYHSGAIVPYVPHA